MQFRVSGFEFRNSRQRRGRVFLILVLLLIGLVYAAPMAISYTPLRSWVAQKALKVDGSVSVGSASLGWFSPVQLGEIEIRDPAGGPVVKVGRVTGDTSLFSLAVNHAKLGTFTVENPDIHIVLRNGGSNIEDTFARWQTPAGEQSPPSSPPNVAIDLKGGSVVVTDTTAHAEWRVSDIQAKVITGEANAAPVRIEANCKLASAAQQGAAQQQGSLKLTLDAPLPTGGAANTPNAGRLTLQAEGLPLAMVQSVAQRYLPGATLSGLLSADANCQWSGESYSVHGQLNVDRVAGSAAALPGGQQIAGGRLTLALDSRPEATGRIWQGEFTADKLVLAGGGQDNSWDRAIHATLQAHDSPTGPIVDQLACDSDFLKLNAAGTPEDFKASAACDLNALAVQLNQFVDLGPTKLAGQGRAELTWKRGADGVIASDGNAEFQNLHLTLPGLFLDEPTVRVDAAGQWNATARQLRLSKASFDSQTLGFTSDDVAVALPQSGWPAVTGTLNYRGDVAGLQRWFHDPRAPLQWRAVGRLSGQTVLGRDQAGGTAQVAARLEDAAIYEVATASNVQGARGTAANNNTAPVWQEKQLDVVAKGSYDASGDAVRLDSCELTSEMLHLTGAGKIEKLSSQQLLDVAGEADYDWEKLTPLLWPYVGKDVKLTGRETRKFSISGPLGAASAAGASPLQELRADAGVGWTTFDLYGLKVGKGELSAALNGGMLKISPLDWDVSEGKLTFAPTARLAPAPAEIQIPKGPVLQKVRLTTEMCHSAIKFIAPALADATRTDGEVSLDLSGGRVPLADATATDLAGTLSVHSVQVLPGAVTKEFLAIAEQIQAAVQKRNPVTGANDELQLVKIADQNIQFRVVQGRVYHKGLEMTTAGGVIIRTQGSVGMDESLDLLAEVILSDKILGDGPIAASIKGQPLQVPIRGTLAQPKSDVKQLVASLIKSGARGFLQDELGKQLDKLLQPKR